MRGSRRAGLVLLSILAACAPRGDEPPAPAATTIDNPAAGIRLLSIPEPFELASNEAAGLELSVPETSGGGTVRITLGDEVPGGLNIVEVVKRQLAGFDAMPEGRSFGQTQLMAPIGLTYMLRGRWDQAGVPMEELRAVLAHPWGNRLLTVAYVYPLGDDTKARGEQLMGLLGEIEALPKAGSESGVGEAGDTR